MTAPTLDPDNPFARASALPYGLPDFASIRVEHIGPAVRAGIAQEVAEVEAIASDASPATVENVLDALELTGDLLDRALTVMSALLDADPTPELEDLEDELTAELSAHDDAMAMHAGVRARLVELAERVQRGEVACDEPARRLLDDRLRDVRRSGADLPAEQREELQRINVRLAELESAFSRTVVAASTAAGVHVRDVGRLAGLTEDEARATHGDLVKTYTTRFRPMLHALADSPQRSLFKLVCVGEEQRVVGLHLLGEGADEMLQGFAVAVKKGITLADLHDTVAIHPTSAEEVVLMR